MAVSFIFLNLEFIYCIHILGQGIINIEGCRGQWGFTQMEYKELRARLAQFFNKWNEKHAPAGRVNRLRIQMTDHRINYVFNNQVLCRLDIYSDQESQQILGEEIEEAEKKLLLSILETTSNLATSSQLRTVNDPAERAEIIVLLLRLYHGLEEDVICSFPEVRATFNRKYFQRIKDQRQRTALMARLEDLRTALLTEIRGDEVPISRIERRINYINNMSIAELCILLNATLIETASDKWTTNVKTASDFIRKLCF